MLEEAGCVRVDDEVSSSVRNLLILQYSAQRTELY